MTTMSAPRRRLSREERREQLLDVASELVVEQGIGALTMERLAEWAEVSKALPYHHFRDSDDVLVALHDREVVLLATRVDQALGALTDDDDPVAVLVATYFQAVEDRGDILALVATAGSPVAKLAAPDPHVAQEFTADLLVTHLGLPRRKALLVTGLVVGAMTGAIQNVADELADRRAVEQATVEVIRAGLTALSISSSKRRRNRG